MNAEQSPEASPAPPTDELILTTSTQLAAVSAAPGLSLRTPS